MSQSSTLTTTPRRISSINLFLKQFILFLDTLYIYIHIYLSTFACVNLHIYITWKDEHSTYNFCTIIYRYNGTVTVHWVFFLLHYKHISFVCECVVYWPTTRLGCQNRKCTSVNNRCIQSRNIRILWPWPWTGWMSAKLWHPQEEGGRWTII